MSDLNSENLPDPCLYCPDCGGDAMQDNNSFWCETCRGLWPKSEDHYWELLGEYQHQETINHRNNIKKLLAKALCSTSEKNKFSVAEEIYFIFPDAKYDEKEESFYDRSADILIDKLNELGLKLTKK